MPPKPQFSLMVGNRRLPLDLHSLAVDEDGYFVGPERREISFHFVYRHTRWTARFQDKADHADLSMQADVGVYPFSAESTFARQAARVILDTANTHIGPLFRVVGGKIRVEASMPIDGPVTAVGLVGAIARMLLTLKPYFDVLELILTTPKPNRPAPRPA